MLGRQVICPNELAYYNVDCRIFAPTGDPYGVHVVSSSVFTVKKMFPDEQMRHSIKDMNIVSHGRFPILRPKLKKI